MQTSDRTRLLRELKNQLLFLKDAGYSEIPIESELFPKNSSIPNTTPSNIVESNQKVKTLIQVRDELGNCTRCKLSNGRKNIA